MNEEKLRFDFSYGGAMTPEQMAQVEAKVQGAIDQALPVSSQVRDGHGCQAECLLEGLLLQIDGRDLGCHRTLK